MAIVWSGLSPHPPVIVSEIGKEHCSNVSATIQSMGTLVADFMAHHVDVLILISPHTPRPSEGIATWQTQTINGDFQAFGQPCLKLSFPTERHWVQGFKTRYKHVSNLENQSLDHGALVPLYFLNVAGWNKPTCVVGLPRNNQVGAIGKAIRETCTTFNLRFALLASGDMSHSLTENAPYGFHSSGKEFDHQFTTIIQEKNYQQASEIDVSLQLNAAQDVMESCQVVWDATQNVASNAEFYSYEAPFGVGYTVMKFHGER